jgi:hypothetical protein
VANEQAQFRLLKDPLLKTMLLRSFVCTLCVLLQSSPHIAGLVKPMPRRTATAFSQCGFISMRASGDGSDEAVLIASTDADDDLSARLAFDELATRKVSFSAVWTADLYMCAKIKRLCF